MIDLSELNLNLMPAIVEGYKATFSTAGNIVGASDIPYGMRRIVISKRLALELDWDNKLLSGSMIHRALQKKKVLQCISVLINAKLGYTTKVINNKTYIKHNEENYTLFNIEKEKERYIEIMEGYYFRLHTDIHSTHWDIEIKTTGKQKKMWGDVAPYHLLQLNANMGFNHNKIGWLWLIDRGATKEDERYPSHGGVFNSVATKYDNVWNKYHYLYPHEFDQELFDFTIMKLKDVFTCLKENIPSENIRCPEFVFECDNKCKETCPNPIEKVKMDDNDTCVHCKEIIEMGTYGIIRNDKMYHYTDVKGHPYEDCVKECLSSWEVREE